ncbi:hypothetical protein NDU88_001807 [Pleurodeles waltl]|uniref:Uncharacterized protein n=1 Tax=Pleurodeles waltl TaxID=8319 RepID=A0AAV7SBX3_PLEWA|nr:hypothetical protein NDU88_001807 [Pleurodeles waltl]
MVPSVWSGNQASLYAPQLDPCHRGFTGRAPSAGIDPTRAPEANQVEPPVPGLLTCGFAGVGLSALVPLLWRCWAPAPIGARPGLGQRVLARLRAGRSSSWRMTAALESNQQLLLGVPGGEENGARL